MSSNGGRVKYGDRSYTLEELAEFAGVEVHPSVDMKLVRSRLSRGMGLRAALTDRKLSRTEAARLGAQRSFWRGWSIK